MVYNWTGLIQILWQPTCLLCRTPSTHRSGLCSACRDALPRNARPCRVCALPMPETASADAKCGACLSRSPAFDAVLAPFRYEYPVSDLIAALKFGHRLAAGRVLGQLLTEHIAPLADSRPDCVIPVPLHPLRLRQRGFNQATELARVVTRLLDLPLSTSTVERVAATPAQAGLKRRQRLRNLAGAFACRDPHPPAHVALIDDVVTTGATAEALAQMLKRAGVARVDVWAVARTPRSR